MIYSSAVATNAEVFPNILSIYVKEGTKIADVTYGKGVFWRKIDKSKYEVLSTDLATGTDMRKLPYEDKSLDCLVMDPPYMPYKSTGIKQIAEWYGIGTLDIKTYYDVLKLYCDGITEAERVLSDDGILIVKCQDMVWANKQMLTHVDIINYCKTWFKCEDIFIVMQNFKKFHPMKTQFHARKNHSYFLVFMRSDRVFGYSPRNR